MQKSKQYRAAFNFNGEVVKRIWMLLILLFLSFNFLNIACSDESALQSIAKEIADRLVKEKGRDLLNVVSDPLVLPVELQSEIKTFLIAYGAYQQLKTSFSPYFTNITSVAFSPDGNYALAGSSDKTANLWNLASNWTRISLLKGHDGSIQLVGFSSNSKNALTASSDKIIKVWDLSKKEPISINQYKFEENIEKFLAFSADGKYVLTKSVNDIARIWDLTQYPLLFRELGEIRQLTSGAFSLDSRYLITYSSLLDDIRIWDLTQDPITFKRLRDAKDIRSVALSPDGKFALTGSAYDNTAEIWDLIAIPITFRELKGHTGDVIAVAFSNDGKFALTGARDGTARIWNLTEDPITFKELKLNKGIVRSLAFSPDGKYALIGTSVGLVLFWYFTIEKFSISELVQKIKYERLKKV